ncbi:MAG TPA: galactokinase family protein [Oscillospiraceae bacterium]|nr:galactokinase family protein [Oscillospiraceae bacterium]HPK34815.1 galactokinase family protein [Oscillospiraceae bacterium]HPR75865.1 galactokinase family protein [Oscillospiraceae bacterium]
MLKTKKILEIIRAGGLDTTFAFLYGSSERDFLPQRERYQTLLEEFMHRYGDRDAILVSAPGRVEIGGNHTDHQHGCVLAAAIQLDVIAVVSPNADLTIRLKSRGFSEDRLTLDSLDPRKNEKNTSIALIRGVAAGIKDLGGHIGGFDACTTSDVLKGSGISSSAAFEVLVAAIFNQLYNDGIISHTDEAKIGQFAENVYFGKPSGLMDQMASATGGFVGIDFKDPKNPVITPIEFDFSKTGYTLCIVDTGGSHADLTNEYAAIRQEMCAVAACFGKDYLREVDEEQFIADIPAIRKQCGDRAVLRALHFFADTKRAEEEKEALQKGDFEAFLRLVNESGRSSFMYNQNAYAISDPAFQGISVGLALTERFLNGIGACRLQGGGFGGTIQVFLPTGMLADYKREIEKIFGEGSCKAMRIRSDGSRTVE